LLNGLTATGRDDGWSLPISEVLSDIDLTMDPKRLCRKFHDTRRDIISRPHFTLGDTVDFMSEMQSIDRKRVKRVENKIYSYVELQNIGQGDYRGETLRGWELPQRGKHFAEGGDIYLGAIWGSVQKWCFISNDSEDTVVTNGCHRIRLKQDMQSRLVDVVAFLCSEAYSIQMRGFARGSDGLAEITSDDASKVVIPLLTDGEREEIRPFVESLLSGQPDIHAKVARMVSNNDVGYPNPRKRTSHVALV